jgi:peptide/nickel transport system substrate-binding protein
MPMGVRRASAVPWPSTRRVTCLRHMLAGLLLTAASGVVPAYSASPVTKPLVHAIPNDINSLDPADTRGQQDQELDVNVYERLVEMKFNPRKDGSYVADPEAVVPELAESWAVDGPAITFRLRHDVKFYPTGNPLTAEDFRYAFQRLVEIPANGKNQAGIAGLFTADQVEAVDPYTLKITFMDGPHGAPTAIPVALTSMKFQQFAAIDSVEVKKHVTADDPYARGWLAKNLATTGPYYIANRIPNQQLELKVVPDHTWGMQPAFPQVILRVTGNADLFGLIKGGVVDYAAEGLTGRQYDALAAAGFPVMHSDTPDILRVSMAMDKEPFTDARVRQAMLYAIPYDRIIKTALAGRGKRAICLYNPDDITCNNSFARYTYDPEKAKALLAAAGKPSFSFDFWYSNALPYNNDIAIIIADSLKSLGVTANLKPTPALQLQTAYRARIDGKDESMSGMYLSESTFWLNDPSTLTNSSIISKSDLGGMGNWARYSDPLVDSLHFKFRNSGDAAARTAAYQTIQDRLAESAANIPPLIVMGRTIVTSPRVVGATFSQDPYARYVYLKPKS